jgi:hypothetical protein
MIRNAVAGGASITLEAVPVLNASGAYIWSVHIGSQRYLVRRQLILWKRSQEQIECIK